MAVRTILGGLGWGGGGGGGGWGGGGGGCRIIMIGPFF